MSIEVRTSVRTFPEQNLGSSRSRRIPGLIQSLTLNADVKYAGPPLEIPAEKLFDGPPLEIPAEKLFDGPPQNIPGGEFLSLPTT